MAVKYRYSQALTGDVNLISLYDLSVFNVSPDLKRFIF
jgi:hypothetical protein